MVESWEQIVEYTPGFECDHCQSTELTKMGQISISGSFLVMNIRWILCQKCYMAGWRAPETVTNGSSSIIYTNLRSKETYIYF